MSFACLAYVGPETIMPLTSILAAICGCLMIGWRYIKSAVTQVFRRAIHRKPK